MDALANLRDHCPNWAKRLDELSGQIEQRQLDLAEFAAQQQQQQRPSGQQDGRARSQKSVRNRGSTVSLKPNDDGGVLPGPDTPGRSGTENHKSAAQEARRASVASKSGVDKSKEHPRNGNGNGNSNDNSKGNSPKSSSPSISERQTNQVVAVASAKARATLRRTQLSKKRAAAATESLVSVEGATPKYRSRNLVIVYYDSYVQSFFEELVKFVSASRNLMRKARMAARVAQIKRMAELEMPDDDSDSSDETLPWDGNGTMRVVPPRSAPKALRPESGSNGKGANNGNDENPGSEKRSSGKSDGGNGNGYSPVSSPAVQPYARPGLALSTGHGNGNGNSNGNGQKPSSPTSSPTRPNATGGFSSYSTSGFGYGASQQTDVFDELDKALEGVQSMCEHAAHQFLRDGDCADEIVKIKDRLDETKQAANKEMERLLLQGDAQDESITNIKEQPSQFRTYRPTSVRKAELRSSPTKGESEKPGTKQLEGLFTGSGGALEVDEDAGNDDEVIEPPRLQYRSTRSMGPRRMAP